MASGIGETLRAARRQQSISLADAAAATRVRETYLAALEEEEFTALGGDVYVKGFLRSYARYLALDPEPLIDAYRREHERGDELPPLSRSNRQFDERPGPAPGAIVAALVVTVLAVFALTRFLGGSEPEEPSPGPSPADSPVAEAAPAEVVVPGDSVSIVVTGTGAGTRVVLFADGAVAFDGQLALGESQAVERAGRVAVRAEDAGAVELTVNETPYGPLGPAGSEEEVVFVRETPGETPGETS